MYNDYIKGEPLDLRGFYPIYCRFIEAALSERNRYNETTMKTPTMLYIELCDAIRHVRDQRGDYRCWKDWEAVYDLLPEGYTPPQRDTTVELENCVQYIKSCNDPNVEYVSPQRRIEELEAEVAQLKGIGYETEMERLARYIFEGLTRQSFVDWYEQKFIPFIEDEEMCNAVGITKEQILEQIVEIFRLEYIKRRG